MTTILFCLMLSISFLIISPSSSTIMTLTLSPLPKSKSSSNSWEFASNVLKSSINRAHHLKSKTPNKKSNSSTGIHGTTHTSLYARSYGGYTVSLAFGTPPQKIPLVFDTGSSLNWVPCTSRYTCSNCTFSNIDPSNIITFMPKLSSSTRIIGCKNPKCGWLFGPDVESQCGSECGSNCKRACPTYILQYGLGSTAGLALSETLDFPGTVVKDFFVGCSILSIRQPEGIAGFGRAPASLPNQLKLRKFSYCLVPHKFDDGPRSSKLILARAGEQISTTREEPKSEVEYTPLGKNPTTSPYNEYYYITLTKITVGKKLINLPYKFLTPDVNGDGGTIIDSGTSLTFMERSLFDPLVKELEAQTTHYKRANDAEAQSGFGLCYNVHDVRNVSFPKLVFHFKGKAKMLMPLANYLSFMSDLGAWCLTIVSDSGPAVPSSGPIGPAMILGNYQQQNFYIEYDLENQRLGLKKHKCV
ncbi:probable aspartyl protease At4g16563 [Amaranthus tricolor]|uniref:probable aspartyl protease At4g16563 n=1 Tax=Amaranthus tricolor TaxID=29722 RepID=UPI0025836083|nr:probable aspartyl protease At4g16563 [Amaranthus tricolor]